jgi:hypothetical protein
MRTHLIPCFKPSKRAARHTPALLSRIPIERLYAYEAAVKTSRDRAISLIRADRRREHDSSSYPFTCFRSRVLRGARPRFCAPYRSLFLHDRTRGSSVLASAMD